MFNKLKVKVLSYMKNYVFNDFLTWSVSTVLTTEGLRNIYVQFNSQQLCISYLHKKGPFWNVKRTADYLWIDDWLIFNCMDLLMFSCI